MRRLDAALDREQPATKPQSGKGLSPTQPGARHNQTTFNPKRLSNPPFLGDRIFVLLSIIPTVYSIVDASQDFRYGSTAGLAAVTVIALGKIPLVGIFFSLWWGFVFELLLTLLLLVTTMYINGVESARFWVLFATFSYVLLRLGGIIKPKEKPQTI